MDIQFHASTLEMINEIVWDCQSINLKYEKSIFVNLSLPLRVSPKTQLQVYTLKRTIS